MSAHEVGVIRSEMQVRKKPSLKKPSLKKLHLCSHTVLALNTMTLQTRVDPETGGVPRRSAVN